MSEESRTVTLALSEYQRDNLLWLLNLVVTGHVAFRAANTGDWVGELWFALKPELGPGRPNGNPDLDQPRAP